MEAANEQTTTTTVLNGGVGGSSDCDGDGGPKDITNVAKGKRTKRQRPQSPILFTFSSTNNINNDLTYSPVSSSCFPAGSTTTEDEDTAESLILLSQGQSLDISSRKNQYDYDGNFKFNSKKYIQSTDTGSPGVFVYECKTCSRTFPSFQALGGHRASHRKPKNNNEEMRKPPQEFSSRNNNNYSLSLQLNNRFPSIMKSYSKLHECSICGTEFNSGQALGGHMRRHRVAGGGNKGGNSNNTNAAMLSLIPYNPVTTMEVYDQNCKNDDALYLGLDLNLPAPRETTNAAATAGENENKQPEVHLSTTPTLVNCHY